VKIITIFGTRPEIIRLSLIIKKLDIFFNHIMVHTGQNYDYNLNDIFLNKLNIRKPDYFLGASSESFAIQISSIIVGVEKILLKEQPDALLVLGDTNSGISAYVAKRMGIPVFHMEAGNRCYDNKVPEEVNRIVIDHCSDIYMPYTERSVFNLVSEGVDRNKIYVIGNPIVEVIEHYVKDKKKVNFNVPNEYILITMHRAENVDSKENLEKLIKGMKLIYEDYKIPMIFPVHPRTKSKMDRFNIDVNMEGFVFLDPIAFDDFIFLEKKAKCVITDSGTVQEESCIFKVPNITIRDVTERPETLECGSNILTGCCPDSIKKSFDIVVQLDNKWDVPEEYLIKNVSDKVIKIIKSNIK